MGYLMSASKYGCIKPYSQQKKPSISIVFNKKLYVFKNNENQVGFYTYAVLITAYDVILAICQSFQ